MNSRDVLLFRNGHKISQVSELHDGVSIATKHDEQSDKAFCTRATSVKVYVVSLRRMERGDVTLTTTNQLIAELAGSWTTPEGGQLVRVLMTALQG